jgi:hypothetical protein
LWVRAWNPADEEHALALMKKHAGSHVHARAARATAAAD